MSPGMIPFSVLLIDECTKACSQSTSNVDSNSNWKPKDVPRVSEALSGR